MAATATDELKHFVKQPLAASSEKHRFASFFLRRAQRRAPKVRASSGGLQTSPRHKAGHALSQSLPRRSLRALAITDTELALIAALASMGDSIQPNTG